MRLLSNFLRLPTTVSPTSVLQRVVEVIPVLDALHQISPTLASRPPVQLSASVSRREQGSYHIRPGSPDTPDRILISRHALRPRLTFFHEIAHYLDNQWLHPLKQGFASTYDHDFLPLKSAWEETATVSTLRFLLNKYGRRMTALDRRIFSETLLDSELWARAYAQWVALRSHNHLLLEEMENAAKTVGYVQGRPYTIQWPTTEFVPVAHAIDTLLKAKGLL